MTKLLSTSLVWLAACASSIPAVSSSGKTSADTPAPVAGCTSPQDCGSDETCTAGSCVANVAAGPSGSTHCTSVSDCQSGQVCIQNSCLSSGTGQTCTRDSDCDGQSAACQNNACACTDNACQVRPATVCTVQNAYAVCAANQYCNSGACVTAAACGAQTDCTTAGLLCVDHYCKTPMPCSATTTCESGFVCSGGSCVVNHSGTSCSSNTDCGSGFYCANTGACATGCGSTNDCTTGETCNASHQCGSTGGGSSSSGGTASGGSSSGGTASTCTHDVCTTGVKLVLTCDTCARLVCDDDAYCCKTKWDAQCVTEVAADCGQACP